ncbi:hypothetical protein GOC60_14645 [Sinorhizobium meliloti]|nr:hypothetical protein [Sinorhizobium meliloti]
MTPHRETISAHNAQADAETMTIAIISRNTPMEGVCLAGRWKGWLFRQHRDGHWVSMHKLEQIEPKLPGVLAGMLNARERT